MWRKLIECPKDLVLGIPGGIKPTALPWLGERSGLELHLWSPRVFTSTRLWVVWKEWDPPGKHPPTSTVLLLSLFYLWWLTSTAAQWRSPREWAGPRRKNHSLGLCLPSWIPLELWKMESWASEMGAGSHKCTFLPHPYVWTHIHPYVTALIKEIPI